MSEECDQLSDWGEGREGREDLSVGWDGMRCRMEGTREEGRKGWVEMGWDGMCKGMKETNNSRASPL